MALNFIYLFGFLFPLMLSEFDVFGDPSAIRILFSLTMTVFVALELSDLKINGFKEYLTSYWNWIDCALIVTWYMYHSWKDYYTYYNKKEHIYDGNFATHYTDNNV